ncbi:exodeoxyribonuclease VII large subunit [Gordonibacter sp.]|uniref:exodeoxyribonuclease VII large subunit n=1 Tax=Gordonibacter sp. TaxID=1968902 RepID=UPI002FC9D175
MAYRENEGRSATRGAAGASDSGALSVSGAMALAKGALEGVTVRLIGEVSEVSCKPGYKAAYFTVKDKGAALPCMMWNNRYEATGVRLAMGQLVELTGRFTLYAAKGRMNFDVFSLALAGEGMLRQQVADLARKLEAEGLMQAGRKRPLPMLPVCVGLVTSPRGAAVHDVLRTLRRRFPLARVVVAGVPVEGREAPARVVEGMRAVCSGGAEVVLVVRGGGSFEDLMPFNDEGLARAIAACPVPVVTGIGHEPDTSIADMVADLRASTPTAAAEAVAPARENLESLFETQARSLAACASRCVERETAAFMRLADRPVFSDAAYLFAAEAQTLDLAADRLVRALPANLGRDRVRLDATADRLRLAGPRVVERERSALTGACERFARALPLAPARERSRVEALRDRLIVRGGAVVGRFETEAQVAAARLHDLSPLAVLARGYAVARTEQGAVVKRVEQVGEGSRISVAVSDGELACRVESTRRIETSVEPWEETA